MTTGMLWFNDNRTAALKTRLEQAIFDYQKCYGMRPTLCCLPPNEVRHYQRLAHTLQLALSPSEHLQDGQFWLGTR